MEAKFFLHIYTLDIMWETALPAHGRQLGTHCSAVLVVWFAVGLFNVALRLDT